MASTIGNFSLIDIQTGTEKVYAYDPEKDTILDLKRKVAKKVGYDDEEGAKVKIFWT